MFGSSNIGLILLVTHLLASICVGIIFGKLIKKETKSSYSFNTRKCNSISFSTLGEALSSSILNSVKTIFMVGGFVVLFSVIISIFKQTGLITILAKFIEPLFKEKDFSSGIITGILELTNGLNVISNIHIKSLSSNIILAAFLLGFASFSIMLQILSIISKEKLSIKYYVLGKVLQGLIAMFFTFLILQIPIFNLNLC